jgi:hypothetical protein
LEFKSIFHWNVSKLQSSIVSIPKVGRRESLDQQAPVVDKRADIWSFGVVLWEMFTGKRLFAGGETVAHTLADVLRTEIDFARLPGATPVRIRELLRRCLDRDVKTRLRDIGEARVAIVEQAHGLLATAHGPVPPGPAQPGGSQRAWGAAALLLVVLAVLAFVHFREHPPEARVLHSSILPPENTTFDFTQGLGLLALSPDGKRIVFGARTADGKSPLWTRSLDVPTAQPLAGTEGAIFPFWSPDSRFIGFFADGKLKKIDASGGPAITLEDAASGRGGSWSSEGVIIFSPSNEARPLLRVSSAGGAATPVSNENGSFPSFLPDGQHFLYQEPGGFRRIPDSHWLLKWIEEQISGSKQFQCPVRSGALTVSPRWHFNGPAIRCTAPDSHRGSRSGS